MKAVSPETGGTAFFILNKGRLRTIYQGEFRHSHTYIGVASCVYRCRLIRIPAYAHADIRECETQM